MHTHDADDPVIEKLEKELLSAFPPVVIGRSMIDEATALWDVYDERDDLGSFEGKHWNDLSPALLYRHSALLLWAGDALWRAVLPAYLWHLLHERQRFNDLPFQVAGELTRREDPKSQLKFERRIGEMSGAQRAAVSDVIAYLATIKPMTEPMSNALATWTNLGGEV